VFDENPRKGTSGEFNLSVTGSFGSSSTLQRSRSRSLQLIKSKELFMHNIALYDLFEQGDDEKYHFDFQNSIANKSGFKTRVGMNLEVTLLMR